MAYPDERIRSALRTGWHRVVNEFTPVAVGPVARVWNGQDGDRRYLVCLAPRADRPRVEAGLAALEHLSAHGLVVGRPVHAADGALTVCVGELVLALLHQVAGRPLEAGDPLDQQWWGDLLGRMHRGLLGFDHPGLLRWHWVRPDAGHLEWEPWLRPAVADAVSALTKLAVTDQLTYGVLHGEPAAGAFRIDRETGRTGLAGWGVAATGPLVYDLAAAVIDAGGPVAAAELIDGYTAAAPVTRDEIEAALPVLLRFRWAVRADWCARLLATTAGGGGPCADHDDLPAARAVLAAAREALARV